MLVGDAVVQKGIVTDHAWLPGVVGPYIGLDPFFYLFIGLIVYLQVRGIKKDILSLGLLICVTDEEMTQSEKNIFEAFLAL